MLSLQMLSQAEERQEYQKIEFPSIVMFQVLLKVSSSIKYIKLWHIAIFVFCQKLGFQINMTDI